MAEPRVLVLDDSFIRPLRLFLSRDPPILALILSYLTVPCLTCVAGVPVRQKSSETFFRKLAARKLGQETEGTLARGPPIFEKSVRPRTGASDQGHPTSIFGKYLFGRRFEI